MMAAFLHRAKVDVAGRLVRDLKSQRVNVEVPRRLHVRDVQAGMAEANRVEGRGEDGRGHRHGRTLSDGGQGAKT